MIALPLKRLTPRLLFLPLILILVACEQVPEMRSAKELLEGESITDYLKRENFVGSLVIIDNSDVFFEHSNGLANRKTGQPNDLNTKFRIASLTKQFTAVAIMILQERQLLSVSDPISLYVPDFPRGDEITIHHLLSHTSGIIRGVPGKVPERKLTPQELLDLFKNEPLLFEPGSDFAYSNSGYKVLGFIIEQVSGLSYEAFLQSEIFSPLAMTRSEIGPDLPAKDNSAVGYFHEGSVAKKQNMSFAYSGGGLVSSINDLIQWERSFNNLSILNDDSVATLFTENLENYGYGWRILQLESAKVYVHGGALPGYSTGIVRVPEKGRALILLSNKHYFPAVGVLLNLHRILERDQGAR